MVHADAATYLGTFSVIPSERSESRIWRLGIVARSGHSVVTTDPLLAYGALGMTRWITQRKRLVYNDLISAEQPVFSATPVGVVHGRVFNA